MNSFKIMLSFFLTSRINFFALTPILISFVTVSGKLHYDPHINHPKYRWYRAGLSAFKIFRKCKFLNRNLWPTTGSRGGEGDVTSSVFNSWSPKFHLPR